MKLPLLISNLKFRLLSFYHYLWAFFSALFYGFSSRKMKVIGVTGTKGKSTTLEFISKIFEEAGYKLALLSSLKIKIGSREEKNLFKMTMPGRGYLQKFLRKAKKASCDYALIEVTSEGILQHRHRFIDFKTAVFTNLSPEHIERHGSFENYRRAKGKFFLQTKKSHVLNFDDKNFEYFSKFPSKEKILFTTKEKITSLPKKWKIIRPKNIKIEPRKIKFFINEVEFEINLLGGFNLENALAAISVAILEGISLETSSQALREIKRVPGRMEIVIEKPFLAIVDYVHTPDSLQKVYETLSEISKFEIRPSTYAQDVLSLSNGRNSKFTPLDNAKSNGARIPNSKLQAPKMICVLGACGGGRDRWKRPVLGKIAGKFCDKIILTNEDPYDEDPGQILSEIKSGISNSQFPISNVLEILDRRKAIQRALSLAEADDIVVITGKGAEPWMCVERGKKIAWDDREIVKEEFKKLKEGRMKLNSNSKRY